MVYFLIIRKGKYNVRSLILKLTEFGRKRSMEKSREQMLERDPVYKKDRADMLSLEEKYEALDLTKKQRMLINDYIACRDSMNARCAEVSYDAGIRNAVLLLEHMDLIKKEK